MEDNYPTSKSHVGTGQVKTTGASDRSSSDGGGQLLFSHNEGDHHPNNTQDCDQYQREAKMLPVDLGLYNRTIGVHSNGGDRSRPAVTEESVPAMTPKAVIGLNCQRTKMLRTVGNRGRPPGMMEIVCAMIIPLVRRHRRKPMRGSPELHCQWTNTKTSMGEGTSNSARQRKEILSSILEDGIPAGGITKRAVVPMRTQFVISN